MEHLFLTVIGQLMSQMTGPQEDKTSDALIMVELDSGMIIILRFHL